MLSATVHTGTNQDEDQNQLKQLQLTYLKGCNIMKSSELIIINEPDEYTLSKSTKEIKKKVISHYSNGKNKCECCGESHIDFLTIDHVYGNGKAHKKLIKLSSKIMHPNFYKWLIKNNYPNDPPLQVLCFNCNTTKGLYDQCPHNFSFKRQKIDQHIQKMLFQPIMIEAYPGSIKCITCGNVKLNTEFKYLHKLKIHRSVCKSCYNEIKNKQNKIPHYTIKKAVINHYSNGKNKCECCGVSGIEFLTLHHINNDGNQHRKEVRNFFNHYSNNYYNNTIYEYLFVNNFPTNPSLQVLCYNCNIAMGRGKRNKCPHELDFLFAKTLSYRNHI